MIIIQCLSQPGRSKFLYVSCIFRRFWTRISSVRKPIALGSRGFSTPVTALVSSSLLWPGRCCVLVAPKSHLDSPASLMVDSWSGQTSPFSGHLSGPPFLRSSLEKNAPHAFSSSLLNHDQLGLHETTAWALDFPSTRDGKPTPSGLSPILSGYLALLVPFRASPQDLFSLPISTTTTEDTSELCGVEDPLVFFFQRSPVRLPAPATRWSVSGIDCASHRSNKWAKTKLSSFQQIWLQIVVMLLKGLRVDQIWYYRRNIRPVGDPLSYGHPAAISTAKHRSLVSRVLSHWCDAPFHSCSVHCHPASYYTAQYKSSVP